MLRTDVATVPSFLRQGSLPGLVKGHRTPESCQSRFVYTPSFLASSRLWGPSDNPKSKPADEQHGRSDCHREPLLLFTASLAPPSGTVAKAGNIGSNLSHDGARLA